MDPLSITVGTISLLGALRATSKAVRKLVKLRDAPLELFQLSNEVLDFAATIAKIDTITAMFSEEEGSAPYIATLKKLEERAAGPVGKLSSLLQDHLITNYNTVDFSHPSSIKFSRRSWFRRQGEVKQLQDEIKGLRSEMSKELATASAWSLMAVFRSELRGVRVLMTEVHSNLQRREVSAQGSLPLSPLVDTTAPEPSLPLPVSILTESIINRQSRETIGKGITSSAVTSVTPRALIQVEQHLRAPNVSPTSRPDSIFQVSTSTFITQPCRVYLCTCHCHRVSRVQPLSWVSKVFGSLFIGYSGVVLPFLVGKVKCTEKSCQSAERGMIKATYYFPGWTPFASRMMSVLDSWNSFDSHQLHVRFPRVIPASAELFTLVQKGNIKGVQQLFAENKASVFDVNVTEGRSALHFALTANQPAMAKFLLTQKADAKSEDKYSLSPVDTLWNYIFEDPNKSEYVALRAAFGEQLDETEDLQRRNFSPIHLLVLGISPLNLDDYLYSSSADIDVQCSLGRTPLCWAAQMPNNYKDVQTLMSHGAAVHISDIRGQTPLHLGAETGSYRTLQILLEAASRLEGPHDFQQKICDSIAAMTFGEEELEEYSDHVSNISQFCQDLIEAVDYKGRTAVHFAARTNNLKHARLLLRHGANLDHPDLVNRTPLLIALYWDHHEIVRLFLQYRARLDCIDDNKMTVLHYAARYCKAATLHLLTLEKFQSISSNCHDSQGYTPLEAFLRVRPSMMDETEDEVVVSRLLFNIMLNNTAPEE